jgi:hypothetical protein
VVRQEYCTALCPRRSDPHAACDLCKALDEADRLWYYLRGGFVLAGWCQLRGWLSRWSWLKTIWQAPEPRSDSSWTENLDTWQRQHDEASQTIRRTMLTLVAFDLFCLLALGAPDVSLLSADATIELPFADIKISFVVFLVIGPAVLIALTSYLHIFLGYHRSLGITQQRQPLPFIFNLQTRTARCITGFLFYVLTPLVLLVFSYKAAPRPEGGLLLFLTAGFTAVLVWLAIRRAAPGTRHVRSWLLWLIEGVLVATILLHIFDSRSLISRELELAKADLSKQDLSGTDLRKADLREAILAEADLREANLAEADLRESNLVGANLREAILAGADLRKADLRRADLRKANLVGTNLREADLREADLGEAILVEANPFRTDLRGANLVGSHLDGITLSKVESGEIDAFAPHRRSSLPAKFQQAWWNEETQWPDGYMPPCPQNLPDAPCEP